MNELHSEIRLLLLYSTRWHNVLIATLFSIHNQQICSEIENESRHNQSNKQTNQEEGQHRLCKSSEAIIIHFVKAFE